MKRSGPVFGVESVSDERDLVEPSKSYQTRVMSRTGEVYLRLSYAVTSFFYFHKLSHYLISFSMYIGQKLFNAAGKN